MKNMRDIKILVVGDIMLDKYVVGTVERISPEAPVPIINVTDEYHTLGGCGNVVRNIAELGIAVDCISSIGDDRNGLIIEEEIKEIGANPLLIYGSKKTTVKERFIADHRKMQMLRVDRECIKPVESKYIIKKFEKYSLEYYDIIVISDYAKGMITSELMQFLKNKQSSKIIVDPKPINAAKYNGVFMITPNEKEWAEMLMASNYTLKDVKYILKTKGNKGMELFDNHEEESWHIDSEDVPVYNVSGAGDVVIATMAICLAHGLNVLDSSYIANKCAGYAVTQPQTCVVPKKKFIEIYKNYFKGIV
jgi:rfaE bifunctional protein kinase chain/domain